MRIYQKIYIGISLIIVTLLAAMMFVGDQIIYFSFEKKVEKDLLTSAAIIENFEKTRYDALGKNFSITSKLPILEYIFNHPFEDHQDSAKILKAVTQSDLVTIFDERGLRILSVGESSSGLLSPRNKDILQGVLLGAPYKGLWEIDGAMYHAIISPITFQHNAVGAVLIGEKIGDTFLLLLQRLTGSKIALIGHKNLIAESYTKPLFYAAAKNVKLQEFEWGEIQRKEIFGEKYLVYMDFIYPDYFYLILRSLDKELLFYDLLRRNLFLTALYVLLTSLLFGIYFARSFSDPINELVNGVRQVTTGNLFVRVDESRNDEFGALAKSFNEMTETLRRFKGGMMESRKKFLDLTAHMPGMIFQMKINKKGDLHFLYVSEGCQALLGIAAPNIEKDINNFLDLMDMPQRYRFVESIRESVRHLTPWAWVGHMTLKKKNTYLQGTAHPEPQEDGSVLLYGQILDATEKVLLKKELETRKSSSRDQPHTKKD